MITWKQMKLVRRQDSQMTLTQFSQLLGQICLSFPEYGQVFSRTRPCSVKNFLISSYLPILPDVLHMFLILFIKCCGDSSTTTPLRASHASMHLAIATAQHKSIIKNRQIFSIY